MRKLISTFDHEPRVVMIFINVFILIEFEFYNLFDRKFVENSYKKYSFSFNLNGRT